MESEIVWDKFRTPGLVEPYIVHFPNYTKGEIYVIYIKNSVSVMLIVTDQKLQKS